MTDAGRLGMRVSFSTMNPTYICSVKKHCIFTSWMENVHLGRWRNSTSTGAPSNTAGFLHRLYIFQRFQNEASCTVFAVLLLLFFFVGAEGFTRKLQFYKSIDVPQIAHIHFFCEFFCGKI